MRIFDKLQGRRPPPTPSTNRSCKACVLKYESTCFPIFLVKTIFKAAHVTMHGLFLWTTSCGKNRFCHVHHNISTRGKKLFFNLGETWCGRSVRQTICDCADQSHQFLRTHHTTIPTNHNMQKNPATEQDPSHPDQPPAKNSMSTPSNKEGGTDHEKDSEKTRS